MVGIAPSGLVDAVYVRLDRERDRFLGFWPSHGGFYYDRQGLADLVAEIVSEHTAALRAELDASNDAVLELLHDLEGGAR